MANVTVTDDDNQLALRAPRRHLDNNLLRDCIRWSGDQLIKHLGTNSRFTTRSKAVTDIVACATSELNRLNYAFNQEAVRSAAESLVPEQLPPFIVADAPLALPAPPQPPQPREPPQPRQPLKRAAEPIIELVDDDEQDSHIEQDIASEFDRFFSLSRENQLEEIRQTLFDLTTRFKSKGVRLNSKQVVSENVSLQRIAGEFS